MSTGTIERTALAGGAGDDSKYIEQGLTEAQEMLKLELAVGPGEFVIEPVSFASESLGAMQGRHRHHIGIHTGRMLIHHKRNPILYSPHRAHLRDAAQQ